MKKLKVALLANSKENAPKIEGMPADQWDDLDSTKTINNLVNAIKAGGHDCEFIEGDISIVANLQRYQPDICFNICEGHFDSSQVNQPGHHVIRKLQSL